jgi:hypothetical protein
MQTYINPIELLKLSPEKLTEQDSLHIRKAKKALLSDIELSDSETLNFRGTEITKSDCLKAIDDLDDKDKKDFHLFIYQHSTLNAFLADGTLDFFENYKVESIYKLPEFVNFVSPYFTFQFSRKLSENFKSRNVSNLKLLLAVNPIVNEIHFESCFKSTYSILKDIENEFIKLRKDIESKNSEYIKDNFKHISQLIHQKVDIELINLLPSHYFQSIRNQIAQSIRNLSVDINNDPYNEYEKAFALIDISKKIKIDGLVSQTITKDFFVIKKNYENKIPKKSAPVKVDLSLTNNSSQDSLKDEPVDISLNKETKDNTYIFYIIFLLIISGLGFFYRPIQILLLILSLTYLIIPLFTIGKDSSFTRAYYFKHKLLFISAICLGFFYPIFGQFYLSYNFIINSKLLLDAFKTSNNDSNQTSSNWSYSIGAVVLTYILNFLV